MIRLFQRFICKFWYGRHQYYKILDFELYGENVKLYKCKICGKNK